MAQQLTFAESEFNMQAHIGVGAPITHSFTTTAACDHPGAAFDR